MLGRPVAWSITFSITLVLMTALNAAAQQTDKIGGTWNNQNSLLIAGSLAKDNAAKPSAANIALLKFKPAGDSGVAKNLANALGRTSQEKATLNEALLQIKKAYAGEVAKQGKANNLAAALTFFITANVVAYHHADPPSDKTTEKLFGSLQKIMAAMPEFTKASNAEKHKMHDWLVCMAGFVMAGYGSAKESKDEESLANFKELADFSLRLVLGIDAARLSFSSTALNVEKPSTAPASGDSSASPAQVVGVWTKSASSPWGLSPTAVATNAGYYKGRYIFSANGAYSFKGESWGGYSRSNEYWTIDESGAYSVKGETITITPKQSKRVLRNRAGAIQKTQANALEKATYTWHLHFFEGIDEMNIVLKPAKPVTRDGAYSGNSDFPKSYLYTQNGNLEWKF